MMVKKLDTGEFSKHGVAKIKVYYTSLMEYYATIQMIIMKTSNPQFMM